MNSWDKNRFWGKVRNQPNGCLRWTAAISNGYGRFWLNGRMGYAHRVAYKISFGHVPDDLQIDHLCKNKLCVNPKHLEAVSAAENNARSNSATAVNARKTHCSKGHPFDDANTRVDPTLGGRACKTCNRLAAHTRRKLFPEQVREYDRRRYRRQKYGISQSV